MNLLRKTAAIISLIISIALPAKGASGDLEYRSSLDELDKVLALKSQYEKEKITRIEALKREIADKSGRELYDIYHKLYSEYELYNFDSAFMYMNTMLDIALAEDDHQKIVDCNLNLAFCCVSAGLFFEANEILQRTQQMKLSEGAQIRVYSVYAKLYFDMARSIKTEPHFSIYNQKSIYYSNLIIESLGMGNPEALPHLANIYRCRQDYPHAAEAITSYMTIVQPDSRGRTLCAGGLGEFSLMVGETADAIAYLCYASIEDTKAVTKETPGLSLLASIVYNNGNVERAFHYANAAMEDAIFYNARHRKMEVANILPIIDANRYELIERQKNSFLLNTVLLSALLLLFLLSGAVIFRQVLQIKDARKMLQLQNGQLKKSNDSLVEANKVKEDYIGYLFRLNSAYMNDLEGLQKFVRRKLVAKQYNDLLNLVSRPDLKKERESKLSSFDDIVLKLFPDFVDQFNTLIAEGERFRPENNHSLTPEMRIFALIRLGINDSEDIAKILNYSVNTINTYKTKVKNRSHLPNEQFESAIRALKSHK